MIDSEHVQPADAEPQDLATRVEALRKRPDVFVRESRVFSRGEAFLGDIESALGFRNEHLRRLKELGVNIPDNEMVGIDESGERPMAIESSARVMGDELDLALVNHDPKVTSADLNTHYSGLLAYMKETYEKGGFFLSDITRNNQQSMLGHTITDLEDKIYLIDLEPVMEAFHPQEIDHANNTHYFRSLDLLQHSVEFAGRFGQDIEEVLAEVKTFRHSIPESIHTGD